MERARELRWTVFLALIALGCDRTEFRGLKGAGSSKSDETQNKPVDDTKRPTEESEGVLGYLVDPSRVTSRVEGSEIVIRGEPQALVKESEASPQTARYAVWSVAAEVLNAGEAADVAPASLDATLIVSAEALVQDGSFMIGLLLSDLPQGAKLALTLNHRSKNRIVLKELRSAPLLYNEPREPGPFIVFRDKREKIETQAEIDQAIESKGNPLTAWECRSTVATGAASRISLDQLDPRYGKNFTLHIRPATNHCTHVVYYVKIAGQTSLRETKLACDGGSCENGDFRVEKSAAPKWVVSSEQLKGLVGEPYVAERYDIIIGASGAGSDCGTFTSYGVALAMTLKDGMAPSVGRGTCGDYDIK